MEVLVEFGIEILLTVIAVIGGFGLSYLRDKTGIEKDGEFDKAVDAALEAAMSYAAKKIHQAGDKVDFDHENEFIELAVEYVASTVPKAMKHFGLTPEKLAKMVESRFERWID